MQVVVCSTHGRSFPVLEASVGVYAPDTELVHLTPTGISVRRAHVLLRGPQVGLRNDFTNFGDAYNAALRYAFECFDDAGVIIANDDVVLTPDTMTLMREDVDSLASVKLGLVGARSDFVLPAQNIRFPAGEADEFLFLKRISESRIKPAQMIAPIFAYISREAFAAAQFPPINWYSDNVICEDLTKCGFEHYVSRAYVHHAGSQTVGNDGHQLTAEAKTWLRIHRPEYMRWFG